MAEIQHPSPIDLHTPLSTSRPAPHAPSGALVCPPTVLGGLSFPRRQAPLAQLCPAPTPSAPPPGGSAQPSCLRSPSVLGVALNPARNAARLAASTAAPPSCV